MSKAAREGDLHTCPKVDPGNKPHVGGPIGTGAATVFICGKRAAVVGTGCTCASPDPDEITAGSSSVYVGGRALARVGDGTKHGGSVAAGCDSVDVG